MPTVIDKRPEELADDLGMLQEKIARLREQETALRDALFGDAKAGEVHGTRFVARLAETTTLSPRIDALPEDLLQDAAIWEASTIETLDSERQLLQHRRQLPRFMSGARAHQNKK